jgi:hypothetical protein
MLAKNQASQMLLIAIEKGTNHVPFSIALMSAHPETAIFYFLVIPAFYLLVIPALYFLVIPAQAGIQFR